MILGTAQAIRRWEPDGSSSQSFGFLRRCMEHLWKHMDIAPLVKRVFEKNKQLAPVHEFVNIQRMVSMSGCNLPEISGRLELQIAVLEMYQPGQRSSPWEFRNLVKDIHANGCHTLRLDYQPPQALRMRILAKRCAELLTKHGEDKDARHVLNLTKEMYVL